MHLDEIMQAQRRDKGRYGVDVGALCLSSGKANRYGGQAQGPRPSAPPLLVPTPISKMCAWWPRSIVNVYHWTIFCRSCSLRMRRKIFPEGFLGMASMY